MTYIASTNIWSSFNGDRIFYQDDAPREVATVLLAARGKEVSEFLVRKYKLKIQPQAANVGFTAQSGSQTEAASGVGSTLETKIVTPEHSDDKPRSRKQRGEQSDFSAE